MKRVIASVLAALSFNAVALDAATVLMPSPLSLVLAYNTYVKDSKKVYYIRVQSQARDFEQAKKQAFRLASEQVAGTVVLSESELRNSNLTRDEIVTYSSGLIDEYKIINRIDEPGYVKLTMDVWITESVMAQRLLAKSATEKGINGDALATRTESILNERQRGDEIIRTILRDYPKRAFEIKIDPAKISMDANRNTIVSVRWNATWDNRYVAAFTDAAKQVGRKPEPLCMWNCAPQPYFLNGYVIDDIQKINMVIDHIKSVRATMRIDLTDIHGRVAARGCQDVIVLQDDYGSPRPNSALVTINQNSLVLARGGMEFPGTVIFNFGQNVVTMSQLGEIRAEVVPASQCKWF